MRAARSDYEIALPLHELDSFARAEGYYSGLPADLRRAQLDRLIDVTTQLYPRLRLSLFDARRVYSAPITIFGPLLAVLYIGRNYMVFRDTERVQALTLHFDGLIREAETTARALPDHLRRLRAALETGPEL